MKKSTDADRNTEISMHASVKEEKSRERLLAELALSAVLPNANTAMKFSVGAVGRMDSAFELMEVLQTRADKVASGDLSDLETTLTAQAATLDTIFNELARRAAENMGAHIPACETYLRMALKAQTQCRATIETLAQMKYPKAPTFVRQQNVAYQQQVNNSVSEDKNKVGMTPLSSHGNLLNQTNELLEIKNGKRMDGRATCTTIDEDPILETLGKVDRPQNKRRKTAK